MSLTLTSQLITDAMQKAVMPDVSAKKEVLEKQVRMGKTSGIRVGVGKCMRVPKGNYK
jgi:hypothetical protein